MPTEQPTVSTTPCTRYGWLMASPSRRASASAALRTVAAPGQHDELVAAEPGHQVARAGLGLQPLRRRR